MFPQTAVKMKPYRNPTRRIFGKGVFDELPEVLDGFQPNSILFVLGEKSFRRSSHFFKLERILGKYSVIDAAPVSQNPQQSFIADELARLKSQNFDLVLAIGGGSVLDTAKIYASLTRPGNPSLEVVVSGKFKIQIPSVSLIAVPTTSGTGSEVTPYASIETPEKKKITIGHSAFYPTVALIDPELTYSMPEYVTASTGFDALSQAIESFWSIHATPFSQTHALRAVELIMPNLEKAYLESSDAAARKAMALGSCEAGLAIAHTKTTAVHSVSYPITSHFGVAHGHACALTLAEFVRFNAPVMKESGAPLLKIFGASDYNAMAAKIEKLMEKIKLKRMLSQLGIHEEGRKIILRDGFRPDRILNNPRPVNIDDLDKILLAIA